MFSLILTRHRVSPLKKKIKSSIWETRRKSSKNGWQTENFFSFFFFLLLAKCLDMLHSASQKSLCERRVQRLISHRNDVERVVYCIIDWCNFLCHRNEYWQWLTYDKRDVCAAHAHTHTHDYDAQQQQKSHYNNSTLAATTPTMMIMPFIQFRLFARTQSEWFSCFCSHNKFVWWQCECVNMRMCYVLFYFCCFWIFHFHFDRSARTALKKKMLVTSTLIPLLMTVCDFDVHMAANWKIYVWKRMQDVSFRKVPKRIRFRHQR